MPDPPIAILAVGVAFHGRYRVVQCINAGSMGAVYEVAAIARKPLRPPSERIWMCRSHCRRQTVDLRLTRRWHRGEDNQRLNPSARTGGIYQSVTLVYVRLMRKRSVAVSGWIFGLVLVAGCLPQQALTPTQQALTPTTRSSAPRSGIRLAVVCPSPDSVLAATFDAKTSGPVVFHVESTLRRLRQSVSNGSAISNDWTHITGVRSMCAAPHEFYGHELLVVACTVKTPPTEDCRLTAWRGNGDSDIENSVERFTLVRNTHRQLEVYYITRERELRRRWEENSSKWSLPHVLASKVDVDGPLSAWSEYGKIRVVFSSQNATYINQHELIDVIVDGQELTPTLTVLHTFNGVAPRMQGIELRAGGSEVYWNDASKLVRTTLGSAAAWNSPTNVHGSAIVSTVLTDSQGVPMYVSSLAGGTLMSNFFMDVVQDWRGVFLPAREGCNGTDGFAYGTNFSVENLYSDALRVWFIAGEGARTGPICWSQQGPADANGVRVWSHAIQSGIVVK